MWQKKKRSSWSRIHVDPNKFYFDFLPPVCVKYLDEIFHVHFLYWSQGEMDIVSEFSKDEEKLFLETLTTFPLSAKKPQWG